MRVLWFLFVILLAAIPVYAGNETVQRIPKSAFVKGPQGFPVPGKELHFEKEPLKAGKEKPSIRCEELKGGMCPVSGGGSAFSAAPAAEVHKTEEKISRTEKKVSEKEEKEKIYRLPISEEELKEGKVVSGVYYVVTPEKTTMINMSNVDINRIVCPVDVQDVVYSEEKGVKVKVLGRNVFVKFQVRKVVEDGEERIEYSTTPVDIHVVCNGKVFPIIAVPKRVPSVLVYLEDKEAEIKERLEESRELSYEERLARIVKEFFTGKIPLNAEFVKDERKFHLYKNLVIDKKGTYVLEGEGIQVSFFEITYNGEKLFVDLNERMFLKKELTARPLAVSLDRLKLKKGEKAVLLIIEKRQGDV